MDSAVFPALRERLLQGGIAPRHVRRIVAELRDHHADLLSEAAKRGLTAEQAAAEAGRRLGDEETLVGAILARSELRSWAHRWPWALYGLTPPLILTATIGAIVVALLLLATVGAGWAPPGWVRFVTRAVLLLSMFGAPLAVGAGVCVAAGRRRASPPWPIAGVLLVSLIGGALDLQLQWPGPGQHGALSVGLTLLPPFPGVGAMLLRTALSSLLVLLPFLLVRARLRSTPRGA